MPSIIPALTPPAGSPNLTLQIEFTTNYTVAAGTHVYAILDPNFNSSALFSHSMYATNLTVDGSVWIHSDTNTMASVVWGYSFDKITFNGDVVVDAHGFARGIWLGLGGSFENNANFYVMSETDNAIGLTSVSPFVNNGTFAVKAKGFADGYVGHGGGVVNGVGARILVEGSTALAVKISSASGAADPPDLLNRGLIEAASTDPAQRSIAVYLDTPVDGVERVENYGTIRADIAIYGPSSYKEISTSVSLDNRQAVTNHAGALIDGDIQLFWGTDSISNQGTILGNIDMGDGDDLVDSVGGTIDGKVDLGFGNDEFRGGENADTVVGYVGNDKLSGNGGADLLLGGFGDDMIDGGAGNDGLYGEIGNDTLRLAGGDRALGGAGDDRFEIADYSFAKIDGEGGRDTWVLAAGARAIDLSNVAASGRVAGIEEISLGGGKTLVIRPGDVSSISGGNQLVVSATGSDSVYLAGAWTQGATSTINGVTYRAYTSGSATVQVQQGATATIGDAPPATLGLDAVAGGAAAALPGTIPGTDLVGSTLYLTQQYDTSVSLTIAQGDTWTGQDIDTLLSSRFAYQPGGEPVVVNKGTLTNERTGIYNAYVFGLPADRSSLYLGSLTNEGTMIARADAGFAAGIFTDTAGYVRNAGSVKAYSNSGGATAVHSGAGDYGSGNHGTINSGEILAHSDTGLAIGVDVFHVQTLDNSGSILAESNSRAFGVMSVGGTINNSGTITATVPTSSNYYSVGIGYYENALTIHNSGTISAEIAILALYDEDAYEDSIFNQATGRIEGLIYTGWGADTIENDGVIVGDVLTGEQVDVIRNRGTITGDIDLGAQDDRYEGATGTLNGIIYAGQGNDTIIGGVGVEFATGDANDDSLDGAGGNDLLLGGFGNDVLIGGTGNDGLFGEFGNDRIVTQGGDYVAGGAGDDRIEAGDLTFELVDGGNGFDTFVMPTGNRILDLTAVLDEGALTRIEKIELQAGQGLVVRPLDVTKLTGNSPFFVSGTASNHIDLIGDWAAAGPRTVGGITYQAFTSGTATVLIGGGAIGAIGTTPPSGAEGLDPFAGGEFAPLPGDGTGLYLTSGVQEVSDLYITYLLTVEAEESWIAGANANAVVYLATNLVFTNHGTLTSNSTTHNIRVVDGDDAATLENTGDILANAGVDYAARAVDGVSQLHNQGNVKALGGTQGLGAEIVAYDDVAGVFQLTNSGQILADGTIEAIGVRFRSPNWATRMDASNAGTIRATLHTSPGGVSGNATGVAMSGLAGRFVNSGLIEAIVESSNGHGYGVDIWDNWNELNPFQLINSGTIRAPIAIRIGGGNGAVAVTNTGTIEGAIALNRGDDTITNTGGKIVGIVDMGAGNDTFVGTGGILIGSVHGGTGNDVYYLESQATQVVEEADGGFDGVVASTGYYLLANIENLVLAAGAGDIFGVGNELNNAITGNQGSNLLIAGAGDDVAHGDGGADALFGQDGNDQLFGDAGIDYLVGGTGNDTLDGGADADALYGEDGNDTLIGGAGFVTDILVGGDGDDILHGDSSQADYDLMNGGDGNDSYYVDTGDDLTFEAAGGGTDTVYANVAGTNNGVYLYANVENLVLLGTTAFGVGNELANTMTGSGSANWLLGGAGNDVLNGKGGNDVLFGEGGSDTFVFEHGTGGDVIGDFLAGTDKIDLHAFGFTSFADVQAHMMENGGTTAIDLGNGDFIVINGVANAALHAGDFVL